MLPLGDSEVSPPWILCEQVSIVLVELCCVSSSGIGVRNNLLNHQCLLQVAWLILGFTLLLPLVAFCWRMCQMFPMLAKGIEDWATSLIQSSLTYPYKELVELSP